MWTQMLPEFCNQYIVSLGTNFSSGGGGGSEHRWLGIGDWEIELITRTSMPVPDLIDYETFTVVGSLVFLYFDKNKISLSMTKYLDTNATGVLQSLNSFSRNQLFQWWWWEWTWVIGGRDARPWLLFKCSGSPPWISLDWLGVTCLGQKCINFELNHS